MPTTGRVVVTADADKLVLLERALDQSGFWELLRSARADHAGGPDDFVVAITPDLCSYDLGATTATEPALVEHLVDLLVARGHGSVVVGAATHGDGRWLENRDVAVVADLTGYGFVTPAGNAYDVVDLSEDLVPGPFPEGSCLSGSRMARAWLEAGFRISFAKAKTHEEHGFALCLHNLQGVLPLRDKLYHYRGRLDPADVCLDLLRDLPVHFNIIDAVVGNHGSFGSRVPKPIATNTIIAGDDTLLTDWVGALKMGLDPHRSALSARALAEFGLPPDYEVVGDLAPWEGWANVSPLLSEAVRRVNDSLPLARALSALATPVNSELFPFKSGLVGRVNAAVSSRMGDLDDRPLARAAATSLFVSLAAVVHGLEGWRTLFSKEELSWREVPLDLDLGGLDLGDYEAVVGYMRPLEQLIAATPAADNGLRWRYLDGSVLFELSREFDVPFDRFVATVDISRSIQLMNDYIGGSTVAVARDACGRITHQAERNVYLPQPNYLVLYGGREIDVTKVEFIRYAEDHQKIFWRTLKSSNGSAEFDDGSVTFSAVGSEATRVTLVGRQKFALPPLLQVLALERFPELKDALVADAYYRFFDVTLSNFLAEHDARPVRIGHPWNPVEGEADVDLIGLGQAELAGGAGADWLATLRRLTPGGLVDALTRDAPDRALVEPRRPEVDDHGFHHFGGRPAGSEPATGRRRGRMMEVGADLAEAIGKDLGLRS